MKALAGASFLDRVKVAWSLLVKKGGGDIPMSLAFNDLRSLMRTAGLKEPYTEHAWVYACVRTIAQNISQVPWEVVTGNEDHPRAVPETDPLTILFDSPNNLPMLGSRYQFWEAILTYLEIRGACIIYMPGRPHIAAVPAQMIPEDPNNWSIDLDTTTGWPLGWWRTTSGVRTPVPLQQVLFLRYFHPTNLWKGMSPLDAARSGVNQDYWAGQYNSAFFENGAFPGGLLIFQDTLTDESYARLKAQWEERHLGSSNAFKVAILEGGAEYRQTILTHHDMEFLEQKKWNRQEICSCFGVPPEIIGFGKDTYQNVLQSRRLFWADTLMNKMRYLEDYLYASFFKYLGTGAEWGHFNTTNVEALQEDYTAKVNTGFKLWQMGYPINAINKRLVLGFQSVPWGDAAWIPFNLQPITDAPEEGGDGNGEPPPGGDGGDDGDGNGNGKHLLADATRKMLQPPPVCEKGFTWDHFIKTLTPLERQAHNKVRRYLFRQRKAVLTKFYQLAVKRFDHADLEELFTVFEGENLRMQMAMRPLHALGVDLGVASLYAELGVEVDATRLADVTDEFLRLRAQLVTGVNDTIRKWLRSTLTEGMAADETTDELARRIRDVYNVGQSRATIVARTEMGSSLNAGRYFSMHVEGVEGGRWVSAQDETVRGSHQACQGVIRLIGDRFPNGLRYPGDPQGPADEAVCCRCFIEPILKVDTTGDEPAAAS